MPKPTQEEIAAKIEAANERAKGDIVKIEGEGTIDGNIEINVEQLEKNKNEAGSAEAPVLSSEVGGFLAYREGETKHLISVSSVLVKRIVFSKGSTTLVYGDDDVMTLDGISQEVFMEQYRAARLDR